MTLRARVQRAMLLGGRWTVAAGVALVIALVTVQFGRVVRDDLRMSGDLHRIDGDIVALQTRRAEQLREIARLRSPEGAIPEIHARLRLVKPNETLVFVKPMPTATP